jgi:hypothetical protein
MININMNSSNRSLWIISLLFVLSILPPLSAWLVYKHGGTSHTIAHGQLIHPAPNLAKLSLNKLTRGSIALKQLQGKWLLVYVTTGVEPQKVLVANLYRLNQVCLALGKNMHRVQPLVILLNQQHKALLSELTSQVYNRLLLTYTNANNWQQIATVPTNVKAAFYIIDPLSNLILTYPANSAAKPLYQDLTRLLEVSHIG